MKFDICASSVPYFKRLKLVDDYPCIKDYRLKIIGSNPTIEIDDLQELLGLINRIDCPIIISMDNSTSPVELEIYDDYRE